MEYHTPGAVIDVNAPQEVGNDVSPVFVALDVEPVTVVPQAKGMALAQRSLTAAGGVLKLQLLQPVAVENLPGFAEGRVSVQDAGAQWAAPLLDAHNGMRVLDACAAPGGKSAHLLELADIELTALDSDATRLARVTQNFARLQLGATGEACLAPTIICGDATQLTEWWDGKPFDRILADAPCSASGVVRRHPDI